MKNIKGTLVFLSFLTALAFTAEEFGASQLDAAGLRVTGTGRLTEEQEKLPEFQRKNISCEAARVSAEAKIIAQAAGKRGSADSKKKGDPSMISRGTIVGGAVVEERFDAKTNVCEVIYEVGARVGAPSAKSGVKQQRAK